MKKIATDVWICDCCGKELVFDYTTQDETDIIWSKESMTSFNISGKGYGSMFDCMNFNFDVCDNCLIKWFSSFKIHPKGVFN
jgi:hypothetical protein